MNGIVIGGSLWAFIALCYCLFIRGATCHSSFDVRYLLTRIAGRVLRRVIGIEREPVRQWTESDLRRLDHLYGLLVASIAIGVVAAIIVTLLARPTC